MAEGLGSRAARVGRVMAGLLVVAFLGGCQALLPKQAASMLEGPLPSVQKPAERPHARPEGPTPARPENFGDPALARQKTARLTSKNPPPADGLEEEVPAQGAPPTPVDLVAQGPRALVGRDQAWVLRELGVATLEEVRAPARVWSYNAADCVISLFFYPKVAGGSFTVLTYEVAPKYADLDGERKCLERLLKERRNVAQTG